MIHAQIDNQPQKFRENEEVPTIKQMSPEEAACQMHFVDNTEIVANRFIVRMAFKD